MDKFKLYKEMTPEEQLNWLTDFSEFTKDKLPALCKLGNAWEASSMKSFEEGLELMDAFAFCREFVKDSLMFRDFARRVGRMQYLIQLIKDEISAGTVVHGANGETLAYVPSLRQSSRRRGRPTDAEIREAMEAAEKNQVEEERAKLIAGLNNSIIVTLAPEDKKDNEVGKKEEIKNEQSTDLFSQAVVVGKEGTRLHFDQLVWLLSPVLQEKIQQVSGLRNSAAYESEKAKQLALAGASEELIEPHSRAACEYTDMYKAIYDQVDNELAMLYLFLETNEDYGMYKFEMEKRNSNIETLKSVLLPYFEKKKEEEGWEEKARSFVSRAADKPIGASHHGKEESLGDSETLETGEEDTSKSDRSARLHKIRTYILRKDVKVTANRVKKMEEMIKEASELGENVDAYNAILEQVREELSAGKNA